MSTDEGYEAQEGNDSGEEGYEDLDYIVNDVAK